MQSSSHLSLFFVLCGPQTLHCWEIPWESDKSKSIDINRIGKTSGLKETHQKLLAKTIPKVIESCHFKNGICHVFPIISPKVSPPNQIFIPPSSRRLPFSGFSTFPPLPKRSLETFRFDWFRPRVFDAQQKTSPPHP